MVKAVFFDFFNTLAYYQPPREKVYIDVCAEHNIHVDEKALSNSLPIADMFWRDANRRSPIDKKTEKDKFAFWTEYVIRALRGAGIETSQELAAIILSKMHKTKMEFKAFPDACTTLKLLKDRGFTLGLISNVGQDMQKAYEELGLHLYLDYYITSFEVGCDKPQPEIFLTALKKAKVKPEETLYIGDQYDLDIVGARGVGMKTILIDRKNWFADITDCPRIQNLSEITKYT
jgi:putative hydrolase of the HAD superfamily